MPHAAARCGQHCPYLSKYGGKRQEAQKMAQIVRKIGGKGLTMVKQRGIII